MRLYHGLFDNDLLVFEKAPSGWTSFVVCFQQIKRGFEGLPALKDFGPLGDLTLRDLHRVFLTAVWRVCDSLEVRGLGWGTQVLSLQIGLIRHGQRRGPSWGPPGARHIHRVTSADSQAQIASPHRPFHPLSRVYLCVTEWLGVRGLGGGSLPWQW